jgi:two-component system NtrC family sensor kinase
MDNVKNRYETLKRLILGSMILVPFIPFILVLGIGYYYFTTALETNSIASMKRIVEDHGQMIDSFLRERRADLEFIINSYRFEDLADPEKLFVVFNQLQKESPTFIDLGIFNEEGIHITYHGPYRLVGRDYGEEDWLNRFSTRSIMTSFSVQENPHFICGGQRVRKGKW